MWIIYYRFLLLVVICFHHHHIPWTKAASVRYRQGRFKHELLRVLPPEEGGAIAIANDGNETDAATITTADAVSKSKSILAIEERMSVAQARKFCQQHPDCVSFGFESAMQFPAAVLDKAYFYPFADWHVLLEGNNNIINMQGANSLPEPAFLEDPSWHLYVNSTRELAAVPREIEMILQKIDELDAGPCANNKFSNPDSEVTTPPPASTSGLRRGPIVHAKILHGPQHHHQECTQPKGILLETIFHIVFPRELKAAATPHLIPKMLQIAQTKHTNQAEKDIRMTAINNLMVMADSKETAPMLIQVGVYEAMKSIIEEELYIPSETNDKRDNTDNNNKQPNNWDGLPILALDVISNIAMYRTANEALQQKGATTFLQHVVDTEDGFPALQALLALLHVADGKVLGKDNDFHLPTSTLAELVTLLQSSIDGDVVYGILWDLIPGPLSAIQLLVDHRQEQIMNSINSGNKAVAMQDIDALLFAGLIEHLLRILEAKCLVASHVGAALYILQALANVSQRAREMILLMAAKAIKQAQHRLEEYAQPAQLAKELTAIVSSHSFGGWMSEL